MAERSNVHFWAEQVRNFSFETEWFKVIKELDFSAGGVLDKHTERTIGNRILLSAPIVDSFLEEIAKNISSKLSRSKLTGLVPAISLFIPWEIMGKIIALFVAYGSEIKSIAKGRKDQNFGDPDKNFV